MPSSSKTAVTVGGAVAGVVGFLLIFGLLFLYRKRRNARKAWTKQRNTIDAQSIDERSMLEQPITDVYSSSYSIPSIASSATPSIFTQSNPTSSLSTLSTTNTLQRLPPSSYGASTLPSPESAVSDASTAPWSSSSSSRPLLPTPTRRTAENLTDEPPPAYQPEAAPFHKGTVH